MLTLQLQPGQPLQEGAGEIQACAFAPDGSYLLSGGWDGHVRTWRPADGTPGVTFKVSDKPVSACAVAPDGRRWLTGSLEGLLARWDPLTQTRVSVFLAHSRPLSAIVFAPDQRTLATSSWDRQLILWDVTQEREGRPMTGHRDIISGCRFTADGRLLVSWSYDGTLRFWDVARAKSLKDLAAHGNRITAGDVSPDGHLAVTASRDGGLRLWDVTTFTALTRTDLPAEVRCCLFLLDGATLLTVDAQGRIAILGVPELDVRAELATGLPVLCGALSPDSSTIAFGCQDGQVRFLTLEGIDDAPLVVRVTQTERRSASTLQRFFGRSRVIAAYLCTCPVCRREFEPATGQPGAPVPCPHCRRNLRVGVVAPAEYVV